MAPNCGTYCCCRLETHIVVDVVGAVVLGVVVVASNSNSSGSSTSAVARPETAENFARAP